MQVPVIHLNGTSKEGLLEQLGNAGSALRDALAALYSTAPNGRDFYPLGPDAIHVAMAEHLARCAHVESVLRDIETIAEAVDAGGGYRETGRPCSCGWAEQSDAEKARSLHAPDCAVRP